jgi:hypothetical protein
MVLYFLAFPKESTTVVIKTSMGNIPKEKNMPIVFIVSLDSQRDSELNSQRMA